MLQRWLKLAAIGLPLWAACGSDAGGDGPAAPAVDAVLGDAATDSSAGSDAVDASAQASCVTDSAFFAAKVWAGALKPKCFGCHNSAGAAQHSKLVLQPEALSGALHYNRLVLAEVAGYEVGGNSIVLQKPLGLLGHAGGAVLLPQDPAFAALAEFVKRLDAPVADDACGPPLGADQGVFAGVKLFSASETYRRATLSLVGRLPTPKERAYLDLAGDAGLEELLPDLLLEPGFLDRVATDWNDRLLTDRYVPGTNAINLLNTKDYPARRWFDPAEKVPLPPSVDAKMMTLGAQHTNRAVAREPLALIRHVVQNNKAFSEILTADYAMVTPFSALTYGVFDPKAFEDPANPEEWKPAKFNGIPHAGLLTSVMLLNRFPTTDTNRNRARSRMVWGLFLATDVMKLAERPIDPTGVIEHNPTMFNANCSVCHTVIDPIAGLFKNWNGQGRFLPQQAWYDDMRPPGYETAVLPGSADSAPLRWLGQQIAQDPRFVTAVVRQVYEMVVGQPPLSLPSDEDESLTPAEEAARVSVFKAQQDDFAKIGKAFVASGQNYRALVAQMVLSRWFRAAAVVSPPKTDTPQGVVRAAELALLPGMRLLTPEQLDRKIAAVTGVAWRGEYDKRAYLLHKDEYQTFYGGIDSDGVTRRIREPNGLMAAVQLRMANEMACKAVPFDLTRPLEDRKLFPYVQLSYVPLDANGFEVPQAKAAVRDNLRHLGWSLLGQRWQDGDPQLEAWYQFFLEVLQGGRAAMAAGTEPATLQYWQCRGVADPASGAPLPQKDQITADPHYTLRSWMAVATAMLSDANFLYDL
jgi:hypothetical protein